MKEELNKIADTVVDEASFLRFLRALADDWKDEKAREMLHPPPAYAQGANGWENGTIGAALDAMIAWANAKPAEDTCDADATASIWRRAANILLAGKYYE